MDDLKNRKAFLRYYRMPEETFDKLVQLLAPQRVVCTIVHVIAPDVPQL